MITVGTQVIGGTSGGGSSGGPTLVPLAGLSSFDATEAPVASPVVVGGAPVSVDPAVFTGSTWTLCVAGSVVSGQTATVTLYDLTAGAAAATVTISAQTETAYTASVTVPGTARTYELRFGVSGSTASHYATLHNAALKIGS